MDSPPANLSCQPAVWMHPDNDPTPGSDTRDPEDGPTSRALNDFRIMSQDYQLKLLKEITEQADEEAENSEIRMLLARLLHQKEKIDIDEIWDAFASLTWIRRGANLPAMDLNPWIDLPQPRTHHADRTGTNLSLARPFRLKSLPPELVLRITEFLPPESRVAFALVHKEIYGLLRRHFPNLTDSPSRSRKFEVLRLLERDHETMVACPSCCVLYTSYQSHASGGRCRISEMHRDDEQGVPPFTNMSLPFLNYNIIRSIAKQRTRDIANGTDECRTLMEALTKTQTIALTGVRAIRTTEPKFVRNGSLVLRSQLLVAPMTEGYLTPSSIRFLKYCLIEHDQRFCVHHSPEEILDNIVLDNLLLDNLVTGWDTKSGWDSRVRGRPENTDFIQLDNRSTDQDGDTFENMLHPAIINILQRRTDGYFKRCATCATEFSIITLSMKSIGPILVITTWKDLGGPCDGNRYSEESRRRFNWDSHCEDLMDLDMWATEDLDLKISRAAGITASRASGVGGIAYSFESLQQRPNPLPVCYTHLVQNSFRAYVEPSTVEKLMGLQRKESMSPREFCDFFLDWEE